MAATAAGWEAIVATVRGLVDTAADLPTLQQQIVAAYGSLESDALTRIMAAAFALAELRGMADVQQESPLPLAGEG